MKAPLLIGLGALMLLTGCGVSVGPVGVGAGVGVGVGISGGGSAPPNQATLKQAEVVRLAKTAAKKENDKTLDDYDLKSVTFDRTNREWNVSFDPKRARRAPGECFIVIVKDDTKETNVRRC